jgi:hypothetical protein
MLENNIVRDPHFEAVAEVKVDSKSRITLGKNKNMAKASIYKVYSNAIGQIILDPQVTIPAHEQWLFKNKEAAGLVRAGLEDAKKGRLVKAREDYLKYTD